jgi:hypothetical protein
MTQLLATNERKEKKDDDLYNGFGGRILKVSIRGQNLSFAVSRIT